MASQFKETEILQTILDRCGRDIAPVCCDVGAMDAKWYSNVFELWHDRGWSGILIERDPACCQKMTKDTEGFPVRVIHTAVTPTGPTSLDEIFRRDHLGPRVGVVSIDIDSCDYHVFKHLTYVQPQIVVIEYNHLMDPTFHYADPEDEVYLRSSLAAVRALAREKGYRFYAATQCNAVFVSESLGVPCPEQPANGGAVRAQRERMMTFCGFELGLSNYYPVFLRYRPWVYRRAVRALMWCTYRVVNWRPVRETIRRDKRRKAFLKPSPRMQKHLKSCGVAW